VCCRRPDRGSFGSDCSGLFGEGQEQAITLATICGRVSFFGGLPMTAPCAFVNFNLIHYRELSISGAYGSMPRHNRTALDLLASGRRHLVRFSSG
jgi:threonine dehydrogenase-like Zn-dependent dehydrogenase